MLSFYGAKVFAASNQWADVGSVQHAAELRQHAATVGAMAVASGAVGMEAVRDWLVYVASMSYYSPQSSHRFVRVFLRALRMGGCCSYKHQHSATPAQHPPLSTTI